MDELIKDLREALYGPAQKWGDTVLMSRAIDALTSQQTELAALIEDNDSLRKSLNGESEARCALEDEVKALRKDSPIETPEWASCETRGPMVCNSLRNRIQKLKIAERRCRNAYMQDYMRAPFTWLADAYAEAIKPLEDRLAALSAASDGGKENG